MIHVLRGTYPITQQLAVTTPGLSIRGEAGAVIELQAPVVPFLLAGGYVVDGADFVFSGNSWGLPANAADIALPAGTQSAAPLLTKARRWCMMYQNILM